MAILAQYYPGYGAPVTPTMTPPIIAWGENSTRPVGSGINILGGEDRNGLVPPREGLHDEDLPLERQRRNATLGREVLDPVVEPLRAARTGVPPARKDNAESVHSSGADPQQHKSLGDEVTRLVRVELEK